jgi:hypothetical protein
LAAAQSADELAKQVQNPVASLISVPLQGNWDFGLGDREATGALLNFQPVIPFAASENTNLILRVITPVMSQPGPEGTRYNGVGDVLTSAFFSPSRPGRIIWGAGPAILLPTATTNALGTEKFALGPTAVVLTQPGNWTVGGLMNQLWSVSGAKDRTDVNQTFLQPFVSYNLGNGLSAGASSEITANWKRDEVWMVPLYFSLSKIVVLGSQMVNIGVGAGPTLTGPTGASSWRFRLSATFLFPR